MMDRLAAKHVAMFVIAAALPVGCTQPPQPAAQDERPASTATLPRSPRAATATASVTTSTSTAPPASREAPPASSQQPGNTSNDSFSRAKKLLKGVYADHRLTIYCGCAYSAGGELDFTACGYVPKNDTGRAHRIEWEHVVPAEAFGQSFAEWRDGHAECVDGKGKRFKGRECARKASAPFRYMEADMYNLYPEIGELNGLRSNTTMAEIAGEAHDFGKCDVKLAAGTFEPRPEVRGDVARTYQYMDAAYPGHGIISGKNRKLFDAWSAQDPVDAWECERARLILKIQGNENGTVAAACRQAGL